MSDSCKIVYLCDWLPPEFGAVGQYVFQMCKDLASSGNHVVLIGLTLEDSSTVETRLGKGRLIVRRLHSDHYSKSSNLSRLSWMFKTNIKLIVECKKNIDDAVEIRFTGSPPLFLHFISIANIFFRKKLTYRITDFYPECIIAEKGRAGIFLRLLQHLTIYWRRRIDRFEALGNDQVRHLSAQGIVSNRISLKRDRSPVVIDSNTVKCPIPDIFRGRLLVLYSGNWGVAHDSQTFVEGAIQFNRSRPGRIGVWINATGAKAELVARQLDEANIAVVKGEPVLLDYLASLLVTPHVHLISLRNDFVGYVLPSKVYACIESRKPILFIGSTESDVHALCHEGVLGNDYFNCRTEDAAAVTQALESLYMKYKNEIEYTIEEDGSSQ